MLVVIPFSINNATVGAVREPPLHTPKLTP